MNDPDQLWLGMPEFKQEKQRPFHEIRVKFATEEDMQAFAELIGQKLTPKTKGVWHPARPHAGGGDGEKRWYDE